MSEQRYFVHESAYVEDGATIGDGTKIWHYTHIMKGAKIGENCSFGQNVYVAKDVTIGNNVKFQQEILGCEGGVVENHLCLQPIVFTNPQFPPSIFPSHTQTNHAITLVRQGVNIGANSIIMTGISIGKHACIGADSIVRKDIPAYAKVAGAPASLVGWLCVCGAELLFQNEHVICEECKRMYHKNTETQIIEV